MSKLENVGQFFHPEPQTTEIEFSVLSKLLKKKLFISIDFKILLTILDRVSLKSHDTTLL